MDCTVEGGEECASERMFQTLERIYMGHRVLVALEMVMDAWTVLVGAGLSRLWFQRQESRERMERQARTVRTWGGWGLRV